MEISPPSPAPKLAVEILPSSLSRTLPLPDSMMIDSEDAVVHLESGLLSGGLGKDLLYDPCRVVIGL